MFFFDHAWYKIVLSPRYRKKVYFFLFFLILIIVVMIELILLSKSYGSLSVIIELDEKGFKPQEIQVRKNTVVKFITSRNEPFWPASNLHPTHQIYPQFDPQRQIEPSKSWEFKFDKVGKWKYHDHLNPNYIATIIVVDSNENKNKAAISLAPICGSVDISKKQQCWDELLEQTVKHKGLDAAFQLFAELYQTDPSIPKACHGWAHILGKAAYELFRNNKDFILKKETSYCGYGFFHGFIEKLLQETGDVKATREFCNYASKQLKDEAPGVYRNCLHGIGHGSIEVDDPKLWGNFQTMLETGLKTCEAVLTDKGELIECFDGSFNAMQQNAYHGEYKLSIDRDDLFKYCRMQKEQYWDSCYYEFTGLIGEVTKHDFKKAASLILKDISARSFVSRTIMKLSADFFQDDIELNDYTKNVLDCRSLPDNLSSTCFDGILLGFIAHGEPNRQYVKGLEFCKYTMLSNQERESCYQWILGQSVKKDNPVCQSVEEKYRNYCQS